MFVKLSQMADQFVETVKALKMQANTSRPKHRNVRLLRLLVLLGRPVKNLLRHEGCPIL